MTTCLLYYGTSEGQTAKVARRIADRLESHGLVVECVEAPRRVEPSGFDAILVGDSVHAGRFHRPVTAFIQRHGILLSSRPSAFFWLCLSAASGDPAERDAGAAMGRSMLERLAHLLPSQGVATVRC